MTQKPISGFDGDVDEKVRHGWRMYTLTSEFELEGKYGTVWTEPTLHAVCGKQHTGAAREACIQHVTNGECSCGIYAYKMPDEPAGQVLADVLLWGMVEVGEKGARATDARIEALFLAPPVCAWHSMAKDEKSEQHQCSGTTLWALNSAMWQNWFPACEAILAEIREQIPDINIETLTLAELGDKLAAKYQCPVVLGWSSKKAGGWFEE